MQSDSYQAVRPLVHSLERSEGRVRCVFRCPRTGVTALSSVSLGKAAGGGFWASLREWVAGLLGGVLGGGESDAEVEEALVLRAFEQVRGRFHWDGEAWHGNAAKLGAGFQRQLGSAPVSQREDRQILARMLVEIACADRDVASEEEAFLGEILGSSYSVSELAKQPKLTRAELQRVERPQAETMLMLAWTMAYCDRELVLSEVNRLNAYASQMGLPEEVVTELRGHAGELLLERALSIAWQGEGWDEDALKEARALAGVIGVEPADLERAEAEVATRE